LPTEIPVLVTSAKLSSEINKKKMLLFLLMLIFFKARNRPEIDAGKACVLFVNYNFEEDRFVAFSVSFFFSYIK
jgi:hypothetical protein